MANLPSQRGGEIFHVRYEDPQVEVRVITNPKHPLYDPRVVTRTIDPEFVASLKMRGQEEAATGYKESTTADGKTVVILSKGRSRWAGMQQVWKELLAEGRSPEDLPPFKLIVRRYRSDTDKFESAIIENEHRVQDDPIAKATKLQQYLDMVGDDSLTRERARIVFNIKSSVMMRNLLKLLQLTPELQAKVASGEMGVTGALHVANLDHDQQEDVLAEVQQITEVTGQRPNWTQLANIARKKAGKQVISRMMSAPEVRDRLWHYEAKCKKLTEEGLDKGLGGRILEAQIHELRVVLGDDQESAATQEQQTATVTAG